MATPAPSPSRPAPSPAAYADAGHFPRQHAGARAATRFSYANSSIVAAGTYTGRVTYTLSRAMKRLSIRRLHCLAAAGRRFQRRSGTTHRVDDSASQVLGSTLRLKPDVLPSRDSPMYMVSATIAVLARLDVSPWQGRQGRIYMVLPEQPSGALTASWSTRGRLLPGVPARAANARLVYAGPIGNGMLEDTLRLRIEADGRRLPPSEQLDFSFEIDRGLTMMLKLPRTGMFRRHPTIAWSAAILACLLLPGVAAAQGFSALVSPPRFEDNAKPGGTYRNVIEITNVSGNPAHFSVRTADWTFQPNASVEFSDALAPGSCRPWVGLEAADINVAANAKRRYRFEVAVPADAPSGECRFAIMVEGDPETVHGTVGSPGVRTASA